MKHLVGSWRFSVASIAMALALSCSVARAASTPVQPAIESTDAGYQRVDRFMKGLTSFEATFKQVLRNSRGEVAEQSSGKLQILRPDRFRWEYAVPHAQTIVSDGSRLWLYDPDLEQVSVRPLDLTLAGTPAMLLSGGGDLRATFTVERVEQGGAGIVWVLLLPKREDTDFRRVRLGFNGEALRFMELEDKLNQTTVLEFIGLKRNPGINADRFTFTPPVGADVIGESQ